MDESPNWWFAGVLAVGFGGGAGVAAAAAVKAIREIQRFEDGHAAFSSETAATIVLAIACWVGVGVGVGYLIGEARGRPGLGIALGLLLGVIGWIILSLLEPTQAALDRRALSTVPFMPDAMHSPYPDGTTRPCPWCAENIKTAAQVCRYCGQPVAPLTT